MQKSQLFKNISWLFFDKVLRIFGSLFVGIWVARYLGPEDFGILNYALAYTGLFMLFVKLGLDQIVIREIIKTPKLTSFLLGTAFWLKLIGSLIAVFLITLSLYFMNLGTIVSIVILITSIGFLFQTLDVVDFYYQSKVLSKYVVIARNSAFLISSILKIYLILHEYNVIYFAIINVLDACLAALFLISIYQRQTKNLFQWKFSKKIAFQLLKYSWPLAVSVFLISIYTKIDQVMIGNMLDVKEVGIYSVAVRLSEFWMFIPGILVSTLMPYFINLREINKKLYEIRLIQLYSLMFWMGVSVGVFTILFGEDIIGTLFGLSYIGAYQALVINIWNGIFISQAIARGIWMIGENMQIFRLYNNLIAVTLNVGLNIVLIPKLGITGAALATLLTQALGTWGFSFLWKPLRRSTWGMIKAVNPIYLINLGKY